MIRETVAARYKRWGFGRTLLLYLMNGLERIGLTVNLVVSRPLVNHPEGPFAQDGLTYRLGDLPSLQLACQDEALQLTWEFVEQAVARGDLCCCAFDDERLVSYVWRAGTEAQKANWLPKMHSNVFTSMTA